MKTKFALSIVVTLFASLLISCNKVDVKVLEGTRWLHEKDGKTLYFDKDGKTLYAYEIVSSAHVSFQPWYSYSIIDSKITLQYKGPEKLLVQPSIHSIKLKNNELTIDFTNGCHGFEKEVYIFKKIDY